MENNNSLDMSERIKRLRDIPIEEVDPDNLKELSDIRIDNTLPVEERIMSLIMQTGNPYVYKDGEVVVKVSFSEKGRTLQSCIEDYLATKTLSR